VLIFIISCLLGFGFNNILPKSINSTLKLLVCPAIGLLLFTEVDIIYSFIFGVSPLSIVLSLFSEGLISFAAFKIFRPSLSSNKPRLFLNIEKVSTTFVVSLMIALISTIYILYSQVLFSSH